jgi:hypothetical protein
MGRLSARSESTEWPSPTPHRISVLRVGRQALTWGSGLVFRPMDLFDPFAPSATDTEYKPGSDMLYTQWLYSDGSDLQFIVVPRPQREGSPPTADASSTAVHLHTVLLGHHTTLLLARDYGDWVGAIGVNGALGGATWNVELVPTFVNGGPTRTSAVGNVSDAMTALGRNATVFLEYFHNGFGVGSGNLTIASLPAELSVRLARGQLFDTRRDYAAAGLTLEVNPLLNVSPTVIVNLDDGSLFALIAATYSLGDNLTLVGGVQIPVGTAGTEFGGLPIAPGSPTLLAPATQIYLQVRQYFEPGAAVWFVCRATAAGRFDDQVESAERLRSHVRFGVCNRGRRRDRHGQSLVPKQEEILRDGRRCEQICRSPRASNCR